MPPAFGAASTNGAGYEAGDRGRRRRLVLRVVVPVVVIAFVAGVVGVAIFGGSNSTVSSGTSKVSPSASRLLRSSLASARKVDSFHYVSSSTLGGAQGGTQKTVGDAGPDQGKQVISAGNQRFTVLVVGRACYLKGNAAALVANLGLTSTTATAYAGQWISLAQSDGPYASVYAAVTAGSALADNITVVPTGQLPPTKVAGRRVETVTGSIAPIRIGGQLEAPKGTATLAVRVTTPHLPVRYTERGTLNREPTTTTVTFDHWGETVDVTAPAHAVSYASLGAGSGTTPTTPGGPVLT